MLLSSIYPALVARSLSSHGCTRLYGVAVVVNGDVGPVGLEKRVVIESGAQLGAGPGS